MKIHKSITYESLQEYLPADDYIGFCTECGAERACTEPDAREYLCEECGAHAVYGVEELLIQGMYNL